MNKRIVRLFQFAGLLAGLLMAGQAFSAASSNVVWNKETRALIANADVEQGAEDAKVCNGCHGKDGNAELEENFPYLAGQRAEATFKQMMDYKDATRGHGIMQNFATILTPEQIANISVYYSRQALPLASVDEATDAAIKLATQGDGDRLLPPCAACHGDKGQGSAVDIPALAGQNPSYFITIMHTFKAGTRANDLYNRMRIIASSLTDQEIEELADYYASIGTPEEDEDEDE
ncbi:MAG TPA: cytochrome c4 [Gammaproteobacteria bacterium]|nr:cytochrome c4 [Gammaproteobacteria bacterium]